MARAKVAFHGDGWVLRRLPLTYRYVGASDADAEGVFTGVNSMELFSSASARGGRRGSIATAEPPCSFSTAGVAAEPVPRGVGTATLTGGGQSASLTCPQNIGVPFITEVATGRTDWQFTGPVAGDAIGVNVPLFVLDLPARP